MSATTKPKMTADAFVAWAMEQPDGQRYELYDGEVWAMSSERVLHVRAKSAAFLSLRDAVRRSGLSCEVFADGASVRIDDHTVFEPDVLVRCGERLNDDVIMILDPIILVEVVSPSSVSRDTVFKFEEYFRLPSLRHYLIVNAGKRTVVHHARNEEGRIESRILGAGPITLDPPGIELADIFADLP